MCGVFGVLSKIHDNIGCALSKGESEQIHRGPDLQNKEIYKIKDWFIGFSHQRLSVLDLSDAGSQPMVSELGNVIIYNGEVYNYKELQDSFHDFVPQTGTDTEILLKVLDNYSMHDALNKCNGMWAFSYLDKEKNALFLVRDRVGIKPLYYTIVDDELIYGSEIKSILKASNKKFSLNLKSVGEYLFQSLQDTSTDTFYENIFSVPAGHFIEIDLNSSELEYNVVKYWDPFKDKQYIGEDLVKHIDELFYDAVKIRLRSDVPVGVTLSGGLDSSSIAAVMNDIADSEQLNILSAVSPGEKNDESAFIDLVAEHLEKKANKVELKWSPSEAISLLRKATWHNDSPLGSFSNVAHYLLMKKAHEMGITVILSGQGADELLCGYKKYIGFYFQKLKRDKKYIKLLKSSFLFMFRSDFLKQINFSEAKRYLPSILLYGDIDISGEALSNYKRVDVSLKENQTIQNRQIEDLQKYSVPFLTHYEDRMSMAFSREIRLPFLDYRLIELFLNLPIEQKLNNGWTKYVFRMAMEKYLPDKITWRKDKQGFVNPQEQWLKKELREEVLELFTSDALIFKLKLVDELALKKKYEVFCNQSSFFGKVWYRDIFAPLALEVWLQLNKSYIDIQE